MSTRSGPRHPKRRPPPRGRAAPAARHHAGRWADLALAVACAALALWMQRRVLGAYFSPDDLIHFERVRGLLVDPPTLWRFLSNQAYMRAALAWWGADPVPSHAVNWLLHAANAVLLYAGTRVLGGGRAAAAVVAGTFAASRLFLPALYQTIGFGEAASLTGTLAALGLALRGKGAWRWASLPVFAVALLNKETVAFAPLALWIASPGPSGERRRGLLPLVALGAVYFVGLALAHGGAAGARGGAYEAGFGMNLVHNLMTYLVWSVDLRQPIPDARAAIDPSAWRLGAAVLVAWIALAAAAWRRTRLPAIGLGWFALALAPVLPLVSHSYTYYLYVPWAGLALALGGAVDAFARGRAWAWAVAAALIAAHATASERLTETRMRLEVAGFKLPLDPFLRKSEVARATVTSFGETIGAERDSVVVYSAAEAVRAFGASSGVEVKAVADSAPAYDLVRNVLDDGRALRAFYPNVDTVVFAGRWTPELAGYRLFVVNQVGRLSHQGRGAQAALRVGDLLILNRYPQAARDLLAEAVRTYPDDARLRYTYGYVLDLLGESVAARAELQELVRRAPNDSLATRARAVLRSRP